MFDLTTSNRVTFNVNVSGTAATPTVCAVVGEHPSHSYKATQLQDGSWEALIELPKDTKPGKLPFRVEVLLNGRLFTPIKTTVEVSAEEPKVEVPVVEPIIVKVEPAPAPAPKIEPAPAPKPAPKPKKVEKLLKSDEPTVPFRESTLTGLAALAKAPVVPLPKRKVPVPEAVEIKKFSLAELTEEATRHETPSPTIREAVMTKTHTPITVIKGDIIYR